jgi:hypothetical protein
MLGKGPWSRSDGVCRMLRAPVCVSLPVRGRLRVLGILGLAALCLAAPGCRRRPAEEAQQPPSATARPAPRPRAEADAPRRPEGEGPSVEARPVEGWSLQERPRPGVAYRYIRDQAEGDFRPTVTIVDRGAKADSPDAARDRALEELRARYPSVEVLSDRAIADWQPPLHQTCYRCTEGGATYRLMQLYFVRSSGEVVVVTFSATASQWDYLQTEFQRILGAVTVKP